MTGDFSIQLVIPQGKIWRVSAFENWIRQDIQAIDPEVSVRPSGGERLGYQINISGAIRNPSDIIRIRKMITQGMRNTAPLYSVSYHFHLTEKES